MKTINLSDTTGKTLEFCETLIDKIEVLNPITETEKKFKTLLSDITKSIAGDLLTVQDFVINGSEVSDFELQDLISDFVESVN
ncbi:MAG TPA: hypothetical protein PL018_12305 [Ignavibacteriaceae bacterium]|nr:hypothetical protein [Ignavibacteriaceae bacterium]